MKVLGIIDGAHDSSACLVEDGRLVAAMSEERLTRIKLVGGFPHESIARVLEVSSTPPEAVDVVAMGSILTPQVYFRFFRSLQKRVRLDGGIFAARDTSWKTRVADFIQFRSGISSLTPEGVIGRLELPVMRALVRRELPPALQQKPIRFVEHHLSHAASAYYTSGRADALCITCDGIGDGTSLAVFSCADGRLKRLHTMRYPDSFGFFYATVTGQAGFKPFRHEGKIMALAAYGRPEAVDVPFPFERRGRRMAFVGQWGQRGRPFFDRLMRHRLEDVAAWLQQGLEERVLDIVAEWVEKAGLRHLCLAGGLFANVRLNQRIHASGLVDSIYIFPHMGDGGLCAGGALRVCAEEATKRGVPYLPRPLDDVFLGPSYDDPTLEKALRAKGIPFEHPPDIDGEIARAVAAGKVVGRFTGRMEFGPRALGNRSILCSAVDPATKDVLNRKLRRTEFMPFAPATREEDAVRCYEGLDGAWTTARYMNIAFECTDFMKATCPGAVHVDRSARPQIVPAANAPLHRVLTQHLALTGLPSIINTSFNVHEEPIVCAPEDAVRTFEGGGLDALALGPFLARRAEA